MTDAKEPNTTNVERPSEPSRLTSPGLTSWSRSERRAAPHWSLIVAALILFSFLIYAVRNYLTPLSLSVAIIILLYPSRRTRELRPLLALIFIVLLVSLWWSLSALLTPFIIAFALAYVLNPILEWAVSKRLPRMVVALAIIGGILGGMVGLGIIIVPRLVEEIRDLAVNVPVWLQQGWNWAINRFVPWIERLQLPLGDSFSDLQSWLPELLNQLAKKVAAWGSSALSGAFSFVTGLLNLILIPILTVYFLNEFRNIRRLVYNAVPEPHRPFAFELYQALNRVQSAYIHGQLLVCLFLAAWIGLGLWLWVGVPYAMLLGICAGLANLIPYVGTAAAGLLTFMVALTQPDPVWTLVKAVIVFSSAQTLEGNLITPKIVGDRVGLHPLAVIFVVLLFATLFGFIGMLLAIPVSASLKEAWKVWRKRKIEQTQTISAS